MKPLICATLAMCWFAPPLLAQTQQPTAPQATKSEPAAQTDLPGDHASQTGGGDKDNPAPHIYKRGEHVSRSYGAFDVITDWNRFHLRQPPTDSHWVKYGDNYLLVKTDSGEITDIVKAS